MTFSIRDLLEADGPATSATLLRRWEKEGVRPAAARKRLQRLDGDEIHRLSGRGLPKNQQLFYLQKDWLSPLFKAAIVDAWRQAGSSYAHALAALEDGFPVPMSQFETRAGAPDRLKGQVPFSRILEHLEHLELLEIVDLPPLGRCAVRRPSTQWRKQGARVHAVALAEQLALDTFRDWLRKLCFISYDAGAVRSPSALPRFGGYPFDLVAPSYARPLATATNNQMKPGFVVADVWLGSPLTEGQLAGFIRKAAVIRSQKKSRPFLAFMIAELFEPPAFKKGKSQGALLTTIENIFGRTVNEALKTLIETLTTAAESASIDPSAISSLFESLGRIEGAAKNLRGPLFELIVAHTVRELDAGEVDIGKCVIAPNGARAEIDVLLRGRSKIRACECKGHLGSHEVSEEDVKEWLTVKVPRWRDWLNTSAHDLRISSACELSVEYWTTGVFSDEAKRYLSEAAARTKKYAISSFDGSAVLELVRKTHARLADTLNEHYIRHALA